VRIAVAEDRKQVSTLAVAAVQMIAAAESLLEQVGKTKEAAEAIERCTPEKLVAILELEADVVT
jgi:hypothetical protein